MKPQDLINGKVSYDKFGGQYFWVNDTNGDFDLQMLAELRGWGRIQNMFKDKKGNIDMDAAAKYQDELGDWIAEAINEKLDTPLITDNLTQIPIFQYNAAVEAHKNTLDLLEIVQNDKKELKLDLVEAHREIDRLKCEINYLRDKTIYGNT